MSDAPIISLAARRVAAAPPGEHAPLFDDRSDHDLMRLGCAGGRDAFAALVRRHAGRLTDFCVKMTGSRAVGEELAQDTWLRVWVHRDDYRPLARFDSFLFTIARNLIKNHQRDRFRRGRVVDPTADVPEAAPSASPSHLDRILEHERDQRVSRELAALPVKLREALLLRFSVGLDYAELSRVVGRNESTVRSRVHHGLRRLHERLGSEP